MWTPSARSPVRNMQMVQASATAGNKQIHEDMYFLLFADPIGALVHSELAGAGKLGSTCTVSS
jgi:hypothetical protein